MQLDPCSIYHDLSSNLEIIVWSISRISFRRLCFSQHDCSFTQECLHIWSLLRTRLTFLLLNVHVYLHFLPKFAGIFTGIPLTTTEAPLLASGTGAAETQSLLPGGQSGLFSLPSRLILTSDCTFASEIKHIKG